MTRFALPFVAALAAVNVSNLLWLSTLSTVLG